jgi:hypothetical protein
MKQFTLFAPTEFLGSGDQTLSRSAADVVQLKDVLKIE